MEQWQHLARSSPTPPSPRAAYQWQFQSTGRKCRWVGQRHDLGCPKMSRWAEESRGKSFPPGIQEVLGGLAWATAPSIHHPLHTLPFMRWKGQGKAIMDSQLEMRTSRLRLRQSHQWAWCQHQGTFPPQLGHVTPSRSCSEIGGDFFPLSWAQMWDSCWDLITLYLSNSLK